MVVKRIKKMFESKPKIEEEKTDLKIQEKQDVLNKTFDDIQKQRLDNIISTLKELSYNKEIMANLKQSRNHTEFKEKINDIIQTYDRKLEDSSIKEHQKLTTVPMVEAKLKELDKWCNEIEKADNIPIWKNIGNVIKHAFKAIQNIGNKEYNNEYNKVLYYMDAVKNAKHNTKNAAKEVQDPAKSLIAQSALKKGQYKS